MPSHGGKREGAGRNPEGGRPKTTKSFSLSEPLIAALELELQDRYEPGDQKSMSKLVEELLRDHEDVRKWMGK